MADGLGVADREADRLACGLGFADRDADRLACGLGFADRDADRLAEWLALTLGEVAPAVPCGEIDAVAERVPPGDNEGVAEGVDVQAETDVETNMAKVAHPAAVSLALRPVPMVLRIFIGPPHASRKWSRSRHRNRNRVTELAAARVGRRQVSESAVGHIGRRHGRHTYAMACSSLEY